MPEVGTRPGRRRWRWQQTPLGELVAEFLGTFVIVAFGDGAVAMVAAALNQSGRGPKPFVTEADWLIIAWGWGFALAFAVWVAGGVSGAHLNPAVTLAQALRRGFPWRKVPTFWLAQLAGAFVAAAMIYFNYHPAINSYEHANHIVRGTQASIPTFSIFATFPAKYYHSWVGPFFDQVIGTAFLVGFILACIDEYNAPVKANMAPLIIGPLVGGAIGAFVYDLGIRNVLIARGATPDPEIADRGVESLDEPGGAA